MFPFAATVATEQPNVPSPGPLRTVTITLHAELCVRTERSPQQAATILIGPGSALYLLIQVLPNEVQRRGEVARSPLGPAVAAEAETRAHTSARISPSRRTTRIFAKRSAGGKWPPSNG